MGKEFIVTSLEDMCDLMCGNIIPKGDKEMAWSKATLTYGYKVTIDLEKVIDRIIEKLVGDFDDYEFDETNLIIKMTHHTGANVWHCRQTLESPAEWECDLNDSIEEVNVQSLVGDALHETQYEEIRTDVEIDDESKWEWDEDEGPDPDRAYDEWRDRQFE